MNLSPASNAQQWLGWMGGLADPTRLRLLALLESQELGVAELCIVLQMPQSTVSRHLKLLSDQGWVQHRSQGTAHLYQLCAEGLSASREELWALVRREAAAWPELAQDRLRLKEHLARRGDDSRSFFAGAAARWDDLRAELYGESYAAAAVTALLPASWVVADLACGTGQVSVELARRVRRVIAVDQSAEMLAAARRRAAGLDGLSFHQAELKALPIEGGCCDAALILLALTYLEDPAVALEEAVRILRPGGVLVVADLLRHDREGFRLSMGQRCLGFEPAALETLLAELGLRQTRAYPLPPDVRAKGPALLLATGSTPRAGLGAISDSETINCP